MEYELFLTPRAERDLEEAFLWYNSQQKGLGKRFIVYIENYFLRIITYPYHYPKKRPPYREVYSKKFPYIIVYKINEAKKSIIIYRVFNTYLSPDTKFHPL
jgi:plasmid stabilization system protein ParE